jgi:ABC-type multidrug transport system ATPase subunit
LIQFTSVSKTYRSITGKAVPAVIDFTIDVREGEVLGLAGPNGAGKSTLIALLLGYLAPTSGSVTIAGRRPRDFIERYGIGYMSELVAIPNAWRTENALERYALLAGVETGRVQERVDAVIALLGLEEHRRKLIKQLSKGNLQRVGIAQALLCDERVLILDEPTHGLDPMWTQRFRELVGDLRRDDRAILIASHNLDELQRVSDRVAIIDRGRLQRVVDLTASGSVSGEMPYRLIVSRGADLVADVFRNTTRVNDLEFDVAPRLLEDLNRELGEFITRGGLVASIAPAHSALEQQFREVVSQ